MSNGTRWTTEEAATVRRMTEEGHGWNVIAQALGRTRSSVRSWAHLNGIKAGEPNGTPWTEEEAATARRMAEEGHGFPAIAEALGRTRKSVHSWAHANGVKTGKFQPWTIREVTRAHALYRAGNTCAEVARILGRGVGSVTHRLWKDGISSRKRSGWWRTDMHATRYALAREGLTADEVIAVLGLTCMPATLRAWMARYCQKSGMPRPWGNNRGRRFRAELVEVKRAALGLTPKVTPR